MATLHSIFQDIADIISEDHNTESLKLKIETDPFEWEKIVPVASSHLIIPLIYCKLKEKELLHLIPEDLKSYLEEITRQNRERNKTILKEVKDISLLLNSEKIDHVFLKGAALLASGIYSNIGERMIGDIDILVHPDQLLQTQDLLLRNDYKARKLNFGSKFIEHKHLARLIPNTKLAAVEIHRKLLHRPVKDQLDPIRILKNKRSVNKIAIPDYRDLLNHTILNFEINDYGNYFNYLGFRNAHDALKLCGKLSVKELDVLDQTKYFLSFFRKVSVYFQIPLQNQRNVYTPFSTKWFLLKQKHRFIRTLNYKFLNIWQFGRVILNRFFLFIGDSKYRQEIIKDRKRINNLIKYKIKSFY